MKKIGLFRPAMGKEEERAVVATLRSGWITLGPKTEEFEAAFSKYVGAKHAIAVNSATAGLHLALIVAGVQKGDEVIAPALTFASTAEAILYVGARPVFADIDPDTLNIDPADIERKITRRTKAIIPVHYGGQPCEMDQINRIARTHKLVVIEDAAHAAGSSYKGTMIGGSKNLTVFSFHAVKNLATGDGGMITTPSDEIARRLRSLRWMGINKSTRERETAGGYRWDYDIVEGGYKYHMNDINAAIGLVQLSKLDRLNDARRAIAAKYDELLQGLELLAPIQQRPNRVNSRHNYAVILKEGVDRESLIGYLAKEGISVGVHYKPLYYHPRYRPFGSKKSTPITDRLWTRILLLPCHPRMSAADTKRVVRALRAFEAQ